MFHWHENCDGRETLNSEKFFLFKIMLKLEVKEIRFSQLCLNKKRTRCIIEIKLYFSFLFSFHIFNMVDWQWWWSFLFIFFWTGHGKKHTKKLNRTKKKITIGFIVSHLEQWTKKKLKSTAKKNYTHNNFHDDWYFPNEYARIRNNSCFFFVYNSFIHVLCVPSGFFVVSLFWN